MTAETPFLKNQESLAPLGSRYVDVDSLPWKPTPYPGVEMKILLRNEASGLMTALVKWAPGAELPMHEHIEIEQSFLLDGSLEDEEGLFTAGNFVWRPAGSQHVARAPNGALVLAMFLRSNIMLAGAGKGRSLLPDR